MNNESDDKAREFLIDVIRQAAARGWCTPENSHKVMDPPLVEAIAAEVEKAVDEHYAMKFAAIMTASIQNTPAAAKDRIGRDNPYWTQAYGDLCVAVDREMAARSSCQATEALRELVACKDLKDEIKRLDDPMNWKRPRGLDEQISEYNRRKPLAWAAARKALAPVPECATPNESSPSEIPNNSFDTPAAPTEAPEWAKRANDYADEGFAFLRDKPTEAPALSREIRLCQDGKPCKKPGECEARGKCAVFYGTPMEALSSLQPPVQGSAELVRKLNSSAAVISNLPEQPGYNGSLLTIDDVESSTIAKHLSEAATALSRQPSQQGPSEEEVFEAKKWKGDRWGAGVCARAILRWAEQSGRKT